MSVTSDLICKYVNVTYCTAVMLIAVFRASLRRYKRAVMYRNPTLHNRTLHVKRAGL